MRDHPALTHPKVPVPRTKPLTTRLCKPTIRFRALGAVIILVAGVVFVVHDTPTSPRPLCSTRVEERGRGCPQTASMEIQCAPFSMVALTEKWPGQGWHNSARNRCHSRAHLSNDSCEEKPRRCN